MEDAVQQPGRFPHKLQPHPRRRRRLWSWNRWLSDAGELSDGDLARIETVALNEPELAGRLVARDGRVGALVITFVKAKNQSAMVAEVPELSGQRH